MFNIFRESQEDVFIGVDVGGSHVSVGLVTTDGELLFTEEQPINALSLEATELISLIVELISHVMDEFTSKISQSATLSESFGSNFSKLIPDILINNIFSSKSVRIGGIGIGCPGQSRDGVLIAASNFPKFKNAPLVNMIHGYRFLSEIPCILVNDADAAISAEVWAASSKQKYAHAENIAMITLGTGIGVGLVLNNRLYQGSFGCVEGGHMIIDSSSEATLCGCGQRGCVEVYASAGNISRVYQSYLAQAANASETPGIRVQHIESKSQTESKALASRPTFQAPPPTAEELANMANAAKGGARYVFEVAERNPLSLAAFTLDQACRYLAIQCINLCRVVDPKIIIVGGGMSKAGTALLQRITTYVKQCTWTVLPTDVELTLAQGMEHAGTIGAALAAKNYANSRPRRNTSGGFRDNDQFAHLLWIAPLLCTGIGFILARKK
jgi:glucokinase